MSPSRPGWSAQPPPPSRRRQHRHPQARRPLPLSHNRRQQRHPVSLEHRHRHRRLNHNPRPGKHRPGRQRPTARHHNNRLPQPRPRLLKRPLPARRPSIALSCSRSARWERMLPPAAVQPQPLQHRFNPRRHPRQQPLSLQPAVRRTLKARLRFRATLGVPFKRNRRPPFRRLQPKCPLSHSAQRHHRLPLQLRTRQHPFPGPPTHRQIHPPPSPTEPALHQQLRKRHASVTVAMPC